MIAERGRMGWQKASGFTRRALAEAAIGRYKRVIGDALRSRTDSRRATEVGIVIQEALSGKVVDWMEHVSDVQYPPW